MGCDGLVPPQACEGLRHRTIKRKCMHGGPRIQGLWLRSSLGGHGRKMSARGSWDHQTHTFSGHRLLQCKREAIPPLKGLGLAATMVSTKRLVHTMNEAKK